jgi:hypothetical protein
MVGWCCELKAEAKPALKHSLLLPPKLVEVMIAMLVMASSRFYSRGPTRATRESCRPRCAAHRFLRPHSDIQ